MMKVAILTNFNEFHPGYSLTGIVCDQARMLYEHGNEVHVFASEEFNDKSFPAPAKATLHAGPGRGVPQSKLIDYRSRDDISPEHVKHANRIADFLARELQDFDIAFSHDWIFTGWNLPYSAGIKMANQRLPKLGWMHWLHSIPTQHFDWWRGEEYGHRHRIISPSKSMINHTHDAYKCDREMIVAIPHIKDLRTWFDFSDEACDFIADHPNAMQADVVCVYPASSDRLTAKNVGAVISIIGAMKRRCLSVCLIIANQWATGRQRRQDLQQFIDLAEEAKLAVDSEFIFTSEWRRPQYSTGISKRFLRELMMCGNLFIFPTREESFGLVSPEAALCGNFLVLNRNLPVLGEVLLDEGLYLPFHSFENQLNVDPDVWIHILDHYAGVILSRMRHNESIMTRTMVRQTLNYDRLYLRHYEPLMHELIRESEQS
ncbi:MAG TPA: glycosyltransferase [Smithellaceae bacterium]|jgi:glycosyltransferase involved in cell wall biosynthesis|nr:glycosyltransferase [Bacillota bacterium]HQC10187.1 glycosyltransferase [Smithellaceae bacterium]